MQNRFVGDQSMSWDQCYNSIAYKQQFGKKIFSRFVFNVEKSIIHE